MDLKISPRIYQEKIFDSIRDKNSLVVLPTGTGKTIVAMMLAIYQLNNSKDSKVLFLAPTKPLCEQHKQTFKENTAGDEELRIMTGDVRPAEREEQWEEGDIIFATPQTIENDLVSRRIDFEDLSLIIFDEAHRAVGDYSYVFLAKQFHKTKTGEGKALALTASPGSSKEKIRNVCENLSIENIEIKTEEDEDVKPYIKEKEIEKVMIELPENLEEVKEILEGCLKKRLKELKEKDLIESEDVSKVNKKTLLGAQRKLRSEIASGNKDYRKMKQISVVSACIKITHCLELLQTQGIKPLARFLEKLKKEIGDVKASKRLFEDVDFKEAARRVFEMESNEIEHPKYEELRDIMKRKVNEIENVIIFTEYRKTAQRIVDMLSNIDGARPVKFVGQKKGMSQKKQKEIIDKFKKGEYNILVSTSIGEEGLHIESANLGIFFESVPSALRSIQRKGRVGRVKIGEVLLLITKGTIDEKYYWIAYHKRRRMKKALEELKEEFNEERKPQKTIEDYSG